MNIVFQENYFNEKNFTIKDYVADLESFNIDFQYTFFKTHCGFLQFFLHKWDRASMANSVEIRSPFFPFVSISM